MKTSSSVTTQVDVSEHRGTSVTVIITVETGLMKTAVSDIFYYVSALYNKRRTISTDTADTDTDSLT